MKVILLIAAWLTPALIAGALGWTGIWGTGSALVEFLIPVPVAGGVLHVPSFLVLLVTVLFLGRRPAGAAPLVAVVAFAACLAAVAAQVDAERLGGWLFTDYQPHGSPLRLDGNPLLLFIATDAFWAGVYALAVAPLPPRAAWLAVPLAPLLVTGVAVMDYGTGAPVFTIGGSFQGSSRGRVTEVVYTSAAYDESLLRDWLASTPGFARPWLSPNAEHVALVFSNSLDAVKSRRVEALTGADTVGTLCLYEEDQRIEAHPGFHDCFSGHETTVEALQRLTAAQQTGLGDDIDRWAAQLALCEGVEPPEERHFDMERATLCSTLARSYQRALQLAIGRYGEDSAQVAYLRSTAEDIAPSR
ncbi:hypothetical protein [Pseudohaliea sp.]|uniref:hypothetical protein n=1 Tax=Pseudohaliea sp. TaxID=2740289 RepID=UPI0032EC43B6